MQQFDISNKLCASDTTWSRQAEPFKSAVRAFQPYAVAFAHAGMEKVIRMYDLENVGEPDKYLQQQDSIRCLTWLADDNTLLCSYSDKPGIA